MNHARSQERLVDVGGTKLCAQTFGRSVDPAVLLVGGATSSMDWWEDGFCARLAAGGRFVIRYDHRDTGRSATYEAGAPPYTGDDLAADAVGLLTALGLDRAHLVGISMGGGIAQAVAIDHPGRVATLTLISTTAAGPTAADLPPMSGRLREVFDDPAPEPDWTDRPAVVDYLVDGLRPFAGSQPFDEARMRELAGRVFDRTTDMAACMTNHWLLDGGDSSRLRPERVTAPTLVLHGTEDPLFPYGHGEALAAGIPDAALVPLERTGHEMPPPEVWDVAIPAILRHTGRSE